MRRSRGIFTHAVEVRRSGPSFERGFAPIGGQGGHDPSPRGWRGHGGPTQSITPPIITPPEPLGVVVVAEDDEATLELLCDNLTADCYDAIPAPSAADALRQCHYRSPDLLLLDIELPDASGLDVLREIRRAERTTGRYDSKLPVIVLSGRSSDTDRTRGLEAGR